MKNDLLYEIALTLVPQIGCVQARILIDHFGSAGAVFKSPVSVLEKLEGIGQIRAKRIKAFTQFRDVESEISFIEKYNIRPLFLTHPDYPRRLLNCYDPPTILYYKGEASLNASRVVSLIGTRGHTEYGRQLTENIITELANYPVLIVSGLAFGIDGVAHRSSLKNNVATVGVLAHGLDRIYPHQHNSLAKDMLKHGGGLLTEFRSDTKPDKHHFPTRNRVVAGMCDAVIVVESGIKGGSMVTAELANGYNRDVFACPGKITDLKSAGCNHLIRTNKAVLLTDVGDFIQTMGWNETTGTVKARQRELFVNLSEEEKVITDLMVNGDQVSIDELYLRSGLSSSRVAAAILSLELQNLIKSLPGKMYSLH